MSRRPKALIASILATGLVALFILRPWEEPPPQHARIGEDEAGLYLEIDMGDTPYDYVCLTSAEYDQLHLAEEWQCPDCRMSKETEDLISGIIATYHPLLMIKYNNDITVEYIHIPESWRYDGTYITEKSNGNPVAVANFSFLGVSRDYEFYRKNNQSQCTTTIPSHELRCAFYYGACKFLFFISEETPFMREAKSVGAQSVNGLGMLLHQGARSLEIWTGESVPVEVMREALRKAVYG